MRMTVRKTILIYTLIPITLIFIIFAVENIVKTRQDVHRRIENHMSDLAYSYASLFNEMLNPIAGIASTTADVLHTESRMQESDIYDLLRLHVEHNPIIYGAWVAFAPYQYDKNRQFVAPYVYREKKDSIIQKDFGIYDYTEKKHEFWNKPVTTGHGVWTEPYFAKVGNIMMSSYVVPFYKEGKLQGVAGIDIPLHEISDNIHIPGVKERNVIVLSSTGKIILFPDDKYIGESIFEVIDGGFDLVTDQLMDQKSELTNSRKQIYRSLVKSMLSGETGDADLTMFDVAADYWYFYAPIKTPGWSFAIRVDESEIFNSVYDRVWYSLFFFSLLLILIIGAIFLFSNKFANAFAWVIERCLRIERMNFQEAKEVKFNIEEIKHLSRTLDRMCAALNSHLSVKEDIRIAKAIRQQTLPTKMRKPPGFEFCVWSHINEESCGETYDSVDYWKSSYSRAKEALGEKPEGTAYLLLDTPEKGIDAAVKNTHLRAIFSSYSKLGVSLLDTVRYMNDYLISDLFLPGPVQAWLAVIDNKDSTFACLNMGLNTAYHYSADSQDIHSLPNYPFALSMRNDITELTLHNIKLNPGDFIIVATDGVWGAINENLEQFGTQRMKNIIIENGDTDAQSLLDKISKSFELFTNNAQTQKDATIMVIKKCKLVK